MNLVFDPGRKSHPEAEALHGYSDWVLRHQLPFSEFAIVLTELLREADLIVAHNAEFDIGFLNGELRLAGLPLITATQCYCTMERFRAERPGARASLDAVAAAIGFARESRRHGALEDAWLALMIYLHQQGCPHRLPFSVLPGKVPINLQAVPPLPSGPLPRRKRRRRAPPNP